MVHGYERGIIARVTTSTSPKRQPPRAVLTALRQEVAFHCPAPSDRGVCGNPYLTWHHFDPPWREEHHHRVDGMIALCQEHATKADNGSYTDDQLRRFKREGRTHSSEVTGRFEWMRQDIVAYAGGNFFHRTPVVLQLDEEPLIWFARNEHAELMLNVQMPPGSRSRTRIVDNVWHTHPGDVSEIICPPGGRSLEVRYSNGDFFKTVFQSVRDADDFVRRFPAAEWVFSSGAELNLTFPVTVVSVTHVTADGIIKLYPGYTETPGQNGLGSCWFPGAPVGVTVETSSSLLRQDQVAELLRIEAERRNGYRR